MPYRPRSTPRPSHGRFSNATDVAVPAANFCIWESAARGRGWLYGVEARGSNGINAFAGMLWRPTRLLDDQIAPLALPTNAGLLPDVSPATQNHAWSPLSSLAELALFKLAVTHTKIPGGPQAAFYVSDFESESIFHNHRGILVKKSLASFRSGEELEQPTAVDARFAFANWEDTIDFACRHPELVWLEDPVPHGIWSSNIPCPVPLATGELATTVADVETILELAVSPALILHLEVSRLGPVGLAKCIELAKRERVPLAFHGHLPLATALVLRLIGVEALVELHLGHLPERVPWPPVRHEVREAVTSKNGYVTEALLASVLQVQAPKQAKKRN